MHRMLFPGLGNAILQYVFKLQKYIEEYLSNFWEKKKNMIRGVFAVVVQIIL